MVYILISKLQICPDSMADSFASTGHPPEFTTVFFFFFLGHGKPPTTYHEGAMSSHLQVGAMDFNLVDAGVRHP